MDTDGNTFVCKQCNYVLNHTAMTRNMALEHAHACQSGIMNIDSLDKMLDVFVRKNVASVQFDGRGGIVGIQFKHDTENMFGVNRGVVRPVALNVTTESEAKVESAGGAQYNPSRKDSLIDLALHPPDDVRFPKDED